MKLFFYRVGVEKPPLRGIAIHDFDNAEKALGFISTVVKKGLIIRFVTELPESDDHKTPPIKSDLPTIKDYTSDEDWEKMSSK